MLKAVLPRIIDSSQVSFS